MRTIRLIAVLFLLAALADDCRAQFGRPPAPVPRAPIPHVTPHVTPHIPGGLGGGSGGGEGFTLGGGGSAVLPWIMGALAVIGGVYGILFLAVSSRRHAGTPPGDTAESIRLYLAVSSRRRAGAANRILITATPPGDAAASCIRIIATPPGDAAESIRRAWVGVELPLIAGEQQPQSLRVLGVLSGAVGSTVGYAVDGQTAVNLLASHDPNAADWWRENAPHVLAAGYQLIFPADVCEPILPALT
jgi:hypothetical protein